MAGGLVSIIKSEATLPAWFKEGNIIPVLKFQLTFSHREIRFTLVTFSVCNVMTINVHWRIIKWSVDAKGLANSNYSMSTASAILLSLLLSQ